MKISVYTNHYLPEKFRINEIVEKLSNNNEIEVITQIPHYPIGKYYKGYGLFSKRKELGEIVVRRLFSLPRYNNQIMLALNYLSYIASSTIFSVFHKYEKTDAIFIYITSPIFISWAALRHGKKQDVPQVMYLLDLWPHNLYSMINVESSLFKKMFNKMCLKIYKNTDHIFVSSPLFIEELVKLGVNSSKISYLPQHAPVFSEKKNIEKKENINIYFIGNFGKAQNIDYLIEIATLISVEKLPIKINMVGKGSGMSDLKDKIVKNQCNNVFEFLGYIDEADMSGLFSGMDFGLVLLNEDDALTTHLPARVQTYFAHGLPIVSYGSQATADIIVNNECGFVLKKNPINNLELFDKIINLDTSDYMKLSNNAYYYAVDNFKLDDIIEEIQEKIISISK